MRKNKSEVRKPGYLDGGGMTTLAHKSEGAVILKSTIYLTGSKIQL